MGYPAPVRADGETGPKALAESVVRVMESPAARLAKASAMAVKNLARRNELELFSSFDLTDDARRRLGYLMERCAEGESVVPEVGRRLRSTGARLHKVDDCERPLLTFLARTNPTLLRLVADQSDELNRRWRVYGEL